MVFFELGITSARAESAQSSQEGVDGVLHPMAQQAGTLHHGGGSGSDFPPLDPRFWGPQAFWLLLSFMILYLIMSRLALPRIGKTLQDRSFKVEQDLKEARLAQEGAEQAKVTYEAQLTQAQQRARQLFQDVQSQSQEALATKRLALEADLAHKLADAEEKIAQRRQKALSEVEAIAKEVSVALVESVMESVQIKPLRF